MMDFVFFFILVFFPQIENDWNSDGNVTIAEIQKGEDLDEYIKQQAEEQQENYEEVEEEFEEEIEDD